MEATREFDLNIEKVLENWEIEHAIREVIANAFDEQIITDTKPVEIFKDKSNSWHIRDFGRGLKYQHFTQNENPEKMTTPGLIGKFGVGLKDALATFDRHNIKIEIESRYGIYTIKHAKKSGFEDIITLHTEIAPPRDKNFVGTDFVIKNCTDEDIEKAKQFFLIFSNKEKLDSTKCGEIYKNSGGPASIYINGVKVAEEPNFLFSYNITSINSALRKAINRERTNVGRSVYTDRVKDILTNATSIDVCKLLLGELKEMSSGLQKDELKWTDVQVRFIKMLNSREDVVFVTTSQFQNMSGREREIIEESNKEIIYIPDNVMGKIEGLDFEITTISKVLKDYSASFKYAFIPKENFSEREKENFKLSQDIINIINPNFNLKNLKISETLRPDENSTRGICEKDGEQIVILREVLNNSEEYCGVLAHELIHARYNHSDCSRDFENDLTNCIGELLSRII